MTGGELSSDILKESLANIRASFAALVTRIVGKLKKKDIDESAFRLYIINLFSPGDIVSHTTSIAEICECLSRHRLWDYNTYHPVEKIATMFANGDDELKGWISDYKSELAAFKATTKIATFIKECDEDDDIADPDQTIQENLARYDKRYCRKLTIKLKARVTEQTLVYIDEFWRSIADHFILQPLSVLLETIREGCMEITWYIPTPSAFQILTCIKTSKEFFQEQGISRLAVDNEILYDEGMDEVGLNTTTIWNRLS